MLLALRLRNFKRYQDQLIDLSSPIILLVGPNSSGKSSILKSLLAFKQTFEDQGDHAGFISRGEYVDIGPYIEYVRNHADKSKCYFDFLVRAAPTRFPLVYRRRISSCTIESVQELDPQTGHGRLFQYTMYLNTHEHEPTFSTASNKSTYFVRYRRMQKSDESYRVSVSREIYDLHAERLARQRIGITRTQDIPSFTQLTEHLRLGRVQARRSTERGMTTSAAYQSVDYRMLNFITSLENALLYPYHYTFVTDLTERTFALAALREIPQRSGPRTDERFRVGSRGENTASVFLNFR
jgi:GTPase SAR1 family protein